MVLCIFSGSELGACQQRERAELAERARPRPPLGGRHQQQQREDRHRDGLEGEGRQRAEQQD